VHILLSSFGRRGEGGGTALVVVFCLLDWVVCFWLDFSVEKGEKKKKVVCQKTGVV